MFYVGIDLGTNNSCITFLDNQKKPNIIRNEINNKYLIPSIIYINKDIKIAGFAAENIKNSISNFKRFIGCDINDKDIISLANSLNLRLSKKDNIIYLNDISLEEIIVTMLQHIKTIIETNIKEEWKCVITIPAYFNENQRKVVWEVINYLNFPCLKLISEPTSAYIAYNQYQNNINKNVFVFDFGAGTLDLSLLYIDNDNICEVISNYGDNYLGGIDITKKIADSFNVDINIAERIKINNEKNIDDILDLYFKDRIINTIDELIKRSNITKEEIDEIVMIGGSSKIGRIHEYIRSYLPHAKINNQNLLINKKVYNYEDVAVSLGAAYHCHHVYNKQDLILIDRLSLSIGVDTNGTFSKIIPRNTIIPTSITKCYTTDTDNQTSVIIDIYQGESKLTKDNIKICSFELSGIRPQAKNVPVIYITIKINQNSLVEIIAKERHGTAESNIVISNLINDKNYINNLIQHADLNRDKEIQLEKLIESYYLLINIVKTLNYHIHYNLTLKLNDQDKKEIISDILDTIYYLNIDIIELELDKTIYNQICLDNNHMPEKYEYSNIKKAINLYLDKIKFLQNKYEIYLIQNNNLIYEKEEQFTEIDENQEEISIKMLELESLIKYLTDTLPSLPLNENCKEILEKELIKEIKLISDKDIDLRIKFINDLCEELYLKSN